MSDDNSQFRRGQIAGLQQICALIATHVLDPGARASFITLLNDFKVQEWDDESSGFTDGVTNTFSEVLHRLQRQTT